MLPRTLRTLRFLVPRNDKKIPMSKARKFYDEYKPYIFSDGWYYVFIVVFIILLFVFFS